jgi:hypothetical protein
MLGFSWGFDLIDDTGTGGSGPTPPATALLWGVGNEILWGTGNYLTWG